jgi:hypothetical protein
MPQAAGEVGEAPVLDRLDLLDERTRKCGDLPSIAVVRAEPAAPTLRDLHADVGPGEEVGVDPLGAVPDERANEIFGQVVRDGAHLVRGEVLRLVRDHHLVGDGRPALGEGDCQIVPVHDRALPLPITVGEDDPVQQAPARFAVNPRALSAPSALSRHVAVEV